MCNPVSTAYPKLLLASGVHRGYEWEVTANRLGFRCGYVRVPKGHPWHGLADEQPDVVVHGGLTYAKADWDCGERGHNGWWLGFDCGHVYDAPDPELQQMVGAYIDGGLQADDEVVRTTDFVRSECEHLIEQAEAKCVARAATDLAARNLAEDFGADVSGMPGNAAIRLVWLASQVAARAGGPAEAGWSAAFSALTEAYQLGKDDSR